MNEFLNIGVGARAQGMSGSMVANTADGTSAYWNPAGLAGVQSPFQINAMHAQWFGGIANYDFVSLTKKFNDVKNGVGSISFIRFGIDNIPNTLNLVAEDGSVDYNRVTFFSDASYAGLISYAQTIGSSGKFSLGGNLKIIHRSTGKFAKSWGFGTDLGLRYQGNHWIYGVNIRDITTTYNSWTFNFTDDEKLVLALNDNEIPVQSSEITLPRILSGAAYKNNYKKIGYLIEGNLVFSTDGRKSALISGKNFAIEPSLGIELDYVKRVFLRFGVNNIQKVKSITDPENTDIELLPTVGLGLKLGRLHVDYALSNIGSVSGVLVSHIFSARLDFYPKPKQP
ncbi:MAG: PorV/PorQ family protein [Saprospiraceae bacterium]|nr:PorV/PorQ family protein [Saprospiraceae bacterium]MBK8817982.1 PorV/PorQ family protein [Saprospiraceae bacterium]MBK9042845.1 PorV/PorQ family protein [Saprospiraceae bacterium]